jgi:inner membrane protein YidH
MSYLDDPRVYFAAERTLLAWQRTAVALIGLGFVVERFGLYIRSIEGAAAPTVHLGASLTFGVAFLVLGAAVAIASAVQFARFVQALSAPERPPGHAIWFAPVVNCVLAAAAVAMAAWFVVAG